MAPNSAIEIIVPKNELEDLLYKDDSKKGSQNKERCPLIKIYLQLIYTKLNEKYFLNKWKVPWVAVIISCIQIFIFMVSTDKVFQILIFDPDKRSEIWRYISYIFLHSDTTQLFLNVVLQLFISFTLETEQEQWKVLLVYILGGIAGSVGSLIFQPTLLMIGGSACVYSILMSHIPHLILNFNCLSFKYLRIVSLIILWFSDIGFSVFYCIKNINTGPTISIPAHCFGAINGILAGFLIYTHINGSSFSLSILRIASFVIYMSGCCWTLTKIWM